MPDHVAAACPLPSWLAGEVINIMLPVFEPMYYDDFYEAPDIIRQRALSGSWYQASGSGFEGLICDSNAQNIRTAVGRISSLLGETLWYRERWQGAFRSLTSAQESNKKKHVHVDRLGLSGVVCLSPEPQGATVFYRHRASGISRIDDSSTFERIAATTGTERSIIEAVLDRDGSDLSQWEVVAEVPYRYNRLIIFDTNQFHSAAPGWGKHIPDGKLTQNFNVFRREDASPLRRLLLMRRSLDQTAAAPRAG